MKMNIISNTYTRMHWYMQCKWFFYTYLTHMMITVTEKMYKHVRTKQTKLPISNKKFHLKNA